MEIKDYGYVEEIKMNKGKPRPIKYIEKRGEREGGPPNGAI